MVAAWEKLFYQERYTATDLGINPDYQALAQSFGIKGIACSPDDGLQGLKDKIKFFLSYPGPILCDFKVESDLCLPLVAPGKSLSDMILFDDNIPTFPLSAPPG